MVKIKRSEYIIISKTMVRLLYSTGCFGKGSLYEITIKKDLGPRYQQYVQPVLNALVKQRILGRKKKLKGWKYFISDQEKAKEIIR